MRWGLGVGRNLGNNGLDGFYGTLAGWSCYLATWKGSLTVHICILVLVLEY
jgi:hypothetical protein